jgi:hypothetical protein
MRARAENRPWIVHGRPGIATARPWFHARETMRHVVFGGLCFTAASVSAMYVLAFVM